MSENTQNQKPTNGAQNTNASGGGSKRHHRHHRGGKKHHRPQQNPAAEGQLSVAQGNAAEAQKPSQPKQNQQKQNQNQQKQNPQKAQQSQQGQQNQQKKNAGEGNTSNKHRNDKKRNRGGKQNRDNRPVQEAASTPLREDVLSSDLLNPTLPTRNIPAAEEKEIAIDEETVKALLESNPMEAKESEPQKKIEVVGIRFRSSGKVYYFDPNGMQAKKGSFAVVETARGPEFGEICLGNTMVNESEVVPPLRPVIRIATPADIAKNEENREKEKQAIVTFQKKIAEHKLEMKPIEVQYAFDGSKILFYFSSDGRVDFRELVKDLASVFRTRIELRQIGIRDEAKMLGGIGACGRMLCCSTFLPDFAQVSIKMAKDQNLSLNSAKISGVCGRLMCCLRYEADVYAEENRKTPGHDATVKTPDGIGTVISSNPLAGTIRVIFKDQPDVPPKQYHRDDVIVLPREKKNAESAKKSEEQ